MAFADWNSLHRVGLANEFVQLTGALAGVEIQRVVALLELVEFFERHNRNHNVIVLKIIDAFVVVEQNVRV